MQNDTVTRPTSNSKARSRPGLGLIATVLAIVFTALSLASVETSAADSELKQLSGAALYAGMPEPEPFAAPASAELLSSTQTNESVSYSLGGTSIRFRAGEHRLFRFDSAGAVARTRTIRLGSPVTFATPHALSTFGGKAYARLDSGSYAGWFVRAAAASPNSLTTFSQPASVRLEQGKHTGLRFYARGRLSVRRSATLSAAETYSASKQATFAKRTYFYLTSGPLSGRWVARSSAVTLVSGSGSESTAPSIAPATWKAIVLIYRQTDVTFTRSDGSTYRLRASISDSMYRLARDVINKFVASASNWSDNSAALDLTVVDVPATLTSLDQLSNGKYWVGPKSVRSAIDQYAPAGTYDNVFVLWQHKDSAGVRVPTAGWGLALPPGSWANGAGYASIHTPTETWWWTDTKHPQEVFLHEWMHTVIFFHENAGRLKLDLHSESQYGYKKVDGTYKAWLSDVMRGRVWDGSKHIGVSYEVWRAGVPTRPQGW